MKDEGATVSVRKEEAEKENLVRENKVELKVDNKVEKKVEKPEIKQKVQEESVSKTGEEQIHSWLSGALESIFQATIDPHKSGLIYLSSLHEDLTSSLLTEDHLDSIFMEILTEHGIPSKYLNPLEYIYNIYHSAYLEKRKAEPKFKQPLIKQIIKLSVSYGFLCFSEPELYINNDLKSSIELFVSKFAALSQFLVDLVEIAIEQDELLSLLNLFLPKLASDLRNLDINDRNYLNYLSLFQTFVNIKPVAAIFSKVDGFQPPTTSALDFENKSLLGPILKLSPLSIKSAPYYFTENASNLSQPQISNTYDSVNSEFKVLIDRLFFIVDKLIRGSPETRQDVLAWFAGLINNSHLRTGSHADLKTLASDGLTYNITTILIKLSLPFLDYPVYSKTNKIDKEFWTKSKLLDILDESRVNATIKEAEEFTEKNSPEDVTTNFISDCFFLTLTYVHYGLGGVIVHFNRLKQMIKQYSERVQMIEQNRVPPGSNPAMLSALRNQMAPLKIQLNTLVAQKHAIQALFESKLLQEETLDFIIGSCTFFIKVFNPTPEQNLKIPIYKIEKVSELDDHEFLKTKTPIPWKFYPEYLLEGIINYCKFSGNFRGCPLLNNPGKVPIFVEFSVILLRCPELLGNPHMKANIVEVLFYGTMPMGPSHPGFFVDIFNENKLVKENLLYSLLDFYVMVEKTGASSQFYDKFNTRFYISNILEELWKNVEYRVQLESYSKANVEFFIRFVARMLNDTTYLLDETFNELNEIHKCQKEKRARASGQPPNEEFGTDEELEEKLGKAERSTKSYMQLSNKTMQLFNIFTKEVPQAFILPEIVDRLASMLDYNLSVMVGPKASNLKVENPESYGFSPRETLKSLFNIYLNLSGQTKFKIAVSRDGRSFSLAYFRKAKDILSRNYVDIRSLDKFIIFAEDADAQRQLDEDEELELGEIPDEFLDPLMFSLMEDPVILPGSKITIDRSTIRAHLLSDATDPFNRMPLKIEDVTPDVELLESIKQFKLSKIAEAQSKNKEDVVMEDA